MSYNLRLYLCHPQGPSYNTINLADSFVYKISKNEILQKCAKFGPKLGLCLGQDIGPGVEGWAFHQQKVLPCRRVMSGTIPSR